jgi:hypothetical protein
MPPAFQAPNRILKFNSSCVIPVESFLTHMHVTHPSPFLLLLAAWRRERALPLGSEIGSVRVQWPAQPRPHGRPPRAQTAAAASPNMPNRPAAQLART